VRHLEKGKIKVKMGLASAFSEKHQTRLSPPSTISSHRTIGVAYFSFPVACFADRALSPGGPCESQTHQFDATVEAR
jgi:hypothetical protein